MKIITLAILVICPIFQNNYITNNLKSSTLFTIVDSHAKQNHWMLITLGEKEWAFHWNSSKSEIIDDDLFKQLEKAFWKNRFYIADKITNLTPTEAIACNEKRHLTIGDMAFLLISKICNLPYYKITGFQNDVYQKDCPYPFGFFDSIYKNRVEIKLKVRKYLRKHGGRSDN